MFFNRSKKYYIYLDSKSGAPRAIARHFKCSETKSGYATIFLEPEELILLGGYSITDTDIYTIIDEARCLEDSLVAPSGITIIIKISKKGVEE